jgi:ribosome-binding protein aMBF1 (putative translation factor)
MIANDQELAIVSRQVAELSARRDRVLQTASERPFQAHIETAGLEKMIARLQEEIQAYQDAKAGEVPPVVTARVHDDSFAEVTAALVRLRLARGMRQEDLARASGKRQPSIARWESDGYDGYTLKELNHLARALGRELEVSFVLPGAAEGEEASTG